MQCVSATWRLRRARAAHKPGTLFAAAAAAAAQPDGRPPLHAGSGACGAALPSRAVACLERLRAPRRAWPAWPCWTLTDPPPGATVRRPVTWFAMRYHSDCDAGRRALARGDEVAMQARRGRGEDGPGGGGQDAPWCAACPCLSGGCVAQRRPSGCAKQVSSHARSRHLHAGRQPRLHLLLFRLGAFASHPSPRPAAIRPTASSRPIPSTSPTTTPTTTPACPRSPASRRWSARSRCRASEPLPLPPWRSLPALPTPCVPVACHAAGRTLNGVPPARGLLPLGRRLHAASWQPHRADSPADCVRDSKCTRAAPKLVGGGTSSASCPSRT